MARKNSQRITGLSLVAVSAVVFSSAGIFTNYVSADAWAVIFWRGLAAAGFTIVYMIGIGQLGSEIRAFGKPAAAATVMMAAGTAAFIPAFKLSSVADVALIWAAAPFVAAALSWLFIAEPPTRTVTLASLVALLGVLVIVSSAAGSGKLEGNMLALFMTLMMAGTMVIYRKWPVTTAALPAALSSLVLLPIAAAIGRPLAAPMHELPILIVFGLAFAIASVSLSEGARRLPSSETALISTLETPLAPVLAYLVLKEVPSSEMMIGGCIIFAAVLWSQRPAPEAQAKLASLHKGNYRTPQHRQC